MDQVNTDSGWYIAGIGAMGTLLAGRLCQANHNVTLILKNQQQCANYQDSPLTLTVNHDTHASQPKAIAIQDIGNEPIQVLVCCVKAYDVMPLLMRLKSNLNERSIVILMHNGLGVLDEIQTQLPELRIIFGVSTLGAYLEKPFAVQAFLEGKIYLGSLAGKFTLNEIHAICKNFQDAGLPYIWEELIPNRMWEKFAINCCINLLTALYGCKNGDLLLHEQALTQIATEVAQVVSLYGFPVTATELLEHVTQVINMTANNYSSMYKDVQNKKPTELHYLNEYLVKLAQQKKTDIPFNAELINQFYHQFSCLQ